MSDRKQIAVIGVSDASAEEFHVARKGEKILVQADSILLSGDVGGVRGTSWQVSGVGCRVTQKSFPGYNATNILS